MKDAAGQTVKIRLGATTEAGEDAEFRAAGTVITFPGFLLAYESGRDEPADEDERAPAAAARGRPDARGEALRSRGARDEPAAALHGGQPRQGARGPRYRPPVHLRLDPRHDRRPRLRLQEGNGARAELRRLRGHAAARGPLRAARRLRLHGPHGGRPRPDRRRRRGAGRVAAPLLLRRRRTRLARARHGAPRRDRRARRQLDRDRSGTGIVLRVGRYGPYLERDGERASVPDDLAPDELTVEKAEELLAAPAGDRSLGSHRGERRSSSRRAATART